MSLCLFPCKHAKADACRGTSQMLNAYTNARNTPQGTLMSQYDAIAAAARVFSDFR